VIEQLPSSVITTEDLLREVKLPLCDDSGRDARTALGVGRTRAYAMAKDGSLPTIRLGRKIWVTTATLRRMLGVDAA